MFYTVKNYLMHQLLGHCKLVGVLVMMFLTLQTFVFAEEPIAKESIDLSFTINNNVYQSNGESKNLDAAPFISNGRTMIPFRAIFEELEYKITWIEKEKKIIATDGKNTVVLIINSNKALINNSEKIMEEPAKIVKGRTVVPLRFISENSNSFVEWQSSTKTANILKIKQGKNLQISPDETMAIFFAEKRNKYYLCKADGTSPKELVGYDNVKWVDNSSIYIEKEDKKYILNLSTKATKEVELPWYYVGVTGDGNNLVANKSTLYYKKDGNYQAIGSVNDATQYIYAKTLEGPFVLYNSDDTLQIMKRNENPVTVGSVTNLIDATGNVLKSGKYKETAFISQDLNNIAFYQYIDKKIWLMMYSTNNLSEPKKTIVDFNTDKSNPITSLKTTWKSNTELVIDTNVFSWNVSLVNDMEVVIHDKRSSQFGFGNVILYTQGLDGKRIFFGNNKDAKMIFLGNKEIVNWYEFKGKILATLMDNTSNKMSLVIYRNNSFETLIDDFNIEETFEFNDNLMIHGFDRIQKFNKLYRFDGEKLSSVQDNFYVGKHIIFKDKLIINKYTNLREYSVVVFGKSSWTPTSLNEGYIIENFVVGDVNLYMTGYKQVGSEKPIASYDGLTEQASSFKILVSDNDVTSDNLVECNGILHEFKDGSIYSFNGTFKQVVKNLDGYNVNLAVSGFKLFKGKLYLNLQSYNEVVPEDGTASMNTENTKYKNQVVMYDGINNPVSIVPEFSMESFYNDDSLIYFIGKKYTVAKLSYDDQVMYIYDPTISTSAINPSRVMDINEIRDTLKIDTKTFIDVLDYSRISQQSRDMVVLYEKGSVTNLIIGAKKTNWAALNNALVFTANEADIDKNKMYTYSQSFNTILNSYDTGLFKKVKDTLFICGKDNITNKTTIYKFIDSNKVKVTENFDINNVIDVKNNYFLLYGLDLDENSDSSGKNILKAYNNATSQLYTVMTDLEIIKMIQIP